MLQRLREARKDEGGFTLIELLVVILIIAILAAIAIPVFLNQRQRGWRSQSQSALKNAATAAETFGTDNNGNYTGMTLGDLTGNGYSQSSGVTMAVTSATTTGYCLTATHGSLAETWSYNSANGEPLEQACS